MSSPLAAVKIEVTAAGEMCRQRWRHTWNVLGRSSFLHSSSLLHLSRAGFFARRVFFDVGGGFQNTMLTAGDWVRKKPGQAGEEGASFVFEQKKNETH